MRREWAFDRWSALRGGSAGLGWQGLSFKDIERLAHMSDLPPPGSRAVFLSYAREDAEAARRIADALRAYGIEVRFDQDEMRGGDSWDQKP